MQKTTEWQLPWGRQTFFARSEIEPTPLSIYLARSGTVTAHSHQWLFVHGGGNGIKCALGDGDELVGTVMSPNVVRFLMFSGHYGEPEETGKLLKMAFDRDASHTIQGFATLVPTNGFSNREQYRAWISDQRPYFDDLIETAKQSW
jgi:hypothetical protein